MMTEYQKIISEILHNVKILLNDYRYIFTSEEVITIENLVKELGDKSHSVENYAELKKLENKLLPFFAKVWGSELTTAENFQVGNDFKFVITCPTVPSISYDENNSPFISASLVTNKHMGTFNGINYGLVCSVDEGNLLSISSSDSHIVCATSDSNIAKSYYYVCNIENNLIFSKKYVMSLRFANQIERDMMFKNIRKNGDFLLKSKANVYSDITLDASKTKFLSVVLFEPYTENDYKQATILAEKFNLEIIKIPVSLYYEKIGINSKINGKYQYDLSNLDTIEYIVSNIDEISHQFSNLIVNIINNKIQVKDENNFGYFIIDKYLHSINIILTKDFRFFKIDFSTGRPKYYIDDDLVSRDLFANQIAGNNIEPNPENEPKL